MNPLDLIPAPYRLAATGLAVLALTGAAWAFVHHRESLAEASGFARGHAEFTRLQADMTAKALAGEQAARAEEARRTQALKENSDEAERLAAHDRAAHAAQDRATGAADERLRNTIATITARSGGTPSNPGTPSQCAADVAALGGVLQACRAEYLSLGRDADEELDDARRRGSECGADYDSLTKAVP